MLTGRSILKGTSRVDGTTGVNRMSTLHIWPESPVRRDGTLVASATIEPPSGDRETLWFSVPEDQEQSLCVNADPFVVGAIYRIMESGHDAKVHGTVSPSLIRNLEDYQAVWSAWLPPLKRARIHADREEETAHPCDREDAIIPFSAGVDSCFTAFRHARAVGPQMPYRIRSAIMVQGFDIPLDEPETFASALDRSRTLLASLGIELMPMATNFRELVSDWPHSFAGALTSCLMLFSNRFKNGLISQGLTYDDFSLLHEGSNPLSDPLLSSDSFRIVPDGAAFERDAKILAMREWDEFLQHLRVCWQGPHKDRNCCKCEKCIRNILTFRALGLGLPACFEHDVDDGQIRTMSLGAGALPNIRYAGLVKLAASTGSQGEWTENLKKRLAARELQRGSHGLKWELKYLLARFKKAPFRTLKQTVPRIYTR